MKSTKDLSIIGVFIALLIGGQFVLNAISGVEVVTVLVASYAFTYGVKRSLILVNIFTIIRCLVFGFFLNVLVLYFIYFNIFVLIFGGIGNKFRHSLTVKRHVVIVIIALLLTVFFTCLDNVITPLFYGYTYQAIKGYFYLSLTALVPHVICTAVTMSILFYPLVKILNKTHH